MEREKRKIFPKGFFWGAATASYQVEGGIENTDWAKAGREGRVPPCGDACDHYNRYEEDFDIARSLGHNAHRLSIEWARIEPEEGKFDEEAIMHYRKVLTALRVRGMKPYVTLWHFTLPLWFSEKGGFEQKDSPEIFARYSAYVVSRLDDLCDSFSTINEPYSVVINGWVRGTWPPFKQFPLIRTLPITNSGRTVEKPPVSKWSGILHFFTIANRLADAHNRAYDAIKHVSPDSDISIVFQVFLWEANWNPLYKVLAWFQNWNMNLRFMNRVHRRCDSIGLNYYFHRKFGDTRVYEKTDMDWNSYPEGIEEALVMLHRYKKPLYVAESGIADEKDVHRADYIVRQVRAMHRAMDRGVDVRGHMYWSLLDNYEWALGFEKRFGLVGIDYKTLERKIRPSAYVYKQICTDNAVQ